MNVDIGLLSLTVPLLDHGRKLFPVTLFVVFLPIQMFEAFMILISPCKWSANTIKVLLAEQYLRCREIMVPLHDVNDSMFT